MSGEIVGRQVTYVEMDLDVYRITQFEAVRAAVAPANWTLRTGANTTLLGALSAAMPSGRAAALAKATSDATVVWGWDIPPAMADVSTVALLRSTVATIDMRVVVRHSTGANFYALRLDGTNADILKGESALESIPFELDPDENVWVRFDAVTVAGPEVLLRAKVWRGALSDEPALFMVAAQDDSSPLTAAGAVGLGTFTNGAAYLCGMFRARSLLGDAVETIRHASPASYLPLPDVPAIPDVASVSVSPTLVSLGVDLGKRATLSVAFADHPGADLGELYGSGSHWAKFRARGIFRRGQPIRLVRGLLGQALGDMERRHYALESFSGPARDGAFVVVAHDLFKAADNDRAQAPRLSNGFLVAPIDADDTAATLSPAGIGNLEYPASGYVAIGGEEICAFTRSGDALTLTRGQFGTVGVAHDSEDRVQLCLHFNAQTPAAVSHLLLTQYAGVDAGAIPLADWELECATYLQRVYARLIAEPTGVRRLLSELIEQAGLAMWHDDVTNMLRMQVLRGIPTTAFTYDETNTLAGSIQPQEQPSTRITQIWTYYGVRNPLESLEEPGNYRSTLATIDTEGESLHGQAIIRKVFATWIPAFGRTTAQRVNDLQIGRFSTPPRRIQFAVQRYSGVEVPALGGGYRIAWHGNQDEAGQPVAAPIQVVQVNPLPDRYEAVAEEMLFKQFDPADLQDRTIIIDSNVNGVNLRTLHDSIYPALTDDDVSSGVTLTCIINAGVIVGSTSTAVPAFDAGDWPVGFTPLLKLNGRIQGKGGNGASLTDEDLIPAQAGGPALYTRHAVDAEYGAEAEIWGGAGGGGANLLGQLGGGGGAGQLPGNAGSSSSDAAAAGGFVAAQPGTTEAGGSGAQVPPLSGGVGGNPGQAGGSSGGVAGAAIDGNSFVNVVSGSADIRGAQIN